MKTFVVKSPIHGYGGMGYENTSILERSFTSEAEARKHLRRCDKAWQITDRLDTPGHPYMTDHEEAFSREMCDNVSFFYRGPSSLFERTVNETQLT